ncbi:MAG TPA: tetratricopeptide repeat protein [Kofleriaceae bacterium]|nr:tetratricopeptide repeat protein [Kofleriaceae bacterium]
MSRAATILLGSIVGALLALGSDARPATAAPTYADANQAYLTGDWSSASQQYAALVEAGIVHPHLYYNLGNAYFRQGQLGPAIYNYERALRLDPGFDDARANLALARKSVATRWDDQLQGAAGDPLWIRAATFFSLEQLSVLLVLLNALFFGGLILVRFMADGAPRLGVRVLNVFTGLSTAALAVLFISHVWFLEKTPLGIALDDEVRLHEGRDPGTRERWVIHAGMRVRITARESGWLRVELANETEGWVRAESIGEL